MTSRKIVRSMAMGTALAFASTSALVSTPAHAQFGGIVYDPSNYAQNVLTAARTLEQINNQIRMLQNQATSLINEAKNLQSLPLTIVQPLQDQIRQTQQLLNEAQRIAYDVRTIEGAFDQHYKNVPLGASQRAMVEGAEARWQNSVAAFEDALKVQAGTVSFQCSNGLRSATQKRLKQRRPTSARRRSGTNASVPRASRQRAGATPFSAPSACRQR